MENALQYLPYVPKTVTTPVGVESHGQMLDAKARPPRHHSFLTQISLRSTHVVYQFCDRECSHLKDSFFLSNAGDRGGALERGFRRVINDVPVGSLLVQSDVKSGEPLLLHVMLPQCLRIRHLAEESWVFVLDVQVIRCHRN